MVKIEIDGQQVEARDGAMIIEAADELGLPIPRFCYHKKLSIAANCRMCLVEVEKARKPMPACATPVTEGMRIYTRSEVAKEAQKGVMEFLLINHPLDCPICDQGGECDLQDLALGYGKDASRFAEKKRVVADKNIGSLITTDMTRCIHCTRCVRFGEEIGGVKELGATGRGEHMSIGTYVEKSLSSELSGNIVDLCPVGALTSKPFRYSARSWELTQTDGVAPHDCVGSNISIESRRNQVMRVLPRENESINETWLSDRDRFSYVGIDTEDRLLDPMIKADGEWQKTDWNTALEHAVGKIKAVVERDGGDQLGALISPSATVEEAHLFQQIVRSLGSGNLDHRLRQNDFSGQDNESLAPTLGCDIESLDQLNAVLLVGSNIRKDQPILGHRIRKAALQGAEVSCVNPVDYDFHFPVKEKCITAPDVVAQELAAIAVALDKKVGKSSFKGLKNLAKSVKPEARHENIANSLKNAKNAAVLIGPTALQNSEYSKIRAFAEAIAQMSGATIGILSEGANASGAWLAGCVPHRGAAGSQASVSGLNAGDMLAQGLKSYLLFNVEPHLDSADSAAALAALNNAECVVSLSPYWSDALADVVDVYLPIGVFAETSGTFVNCEGAWQSFTGAVTPKGEARPGWKVLRVLGNLMGVRGFTYTSSDQVREELKTMVENGPEVAYQWSCPELKGKRDKSSQAQRIADTAIYAVDNIVRRAQPLQETQDGESQASVFVNEDVAKRHGLIGASHVAIKQGDQQVTLSLKLSARVPDGCVLVANGLEETAGLGSDGGYIELTAVELEAQPAA